MAKKGSYDSKSIRTLEFPENVRKRPTMYIGDVGVNGNLHLVREIYDNSLDEFMNGHATTIRIMVDPDKGEVTIEDDGRGIPVDNGVLEKILCTLHSGGKFDKDSYSVSSGLNGVGASCVNALSEYMIVESYRDGYVWRQEFSKGFPTTKLKKVKKTNKTGTKVTFKPDAEIMGTIEIDVETLKKTAEQHAYLNAGLKIIFNDLSKDQEIIFYQPEGIRQYVRDLNKNPLFKEVAYFKTFDEESGIQAEVALSYSKGHDDNTLTFCNGIFTSEGGSHLQGFRMSLSTVIRNFIENSDLMTKADKKNNLTIKGEDTREGLVAVISIRHPNPMFMGQTKQRLNNPDAQGVIQRLINEQLTAFLALKPKEAQAIGKKAIAAARGRQAASAARERERKSAESGTSFASLNDIGKLADCTEKNPEKRELFIVEGDSAGGSAKQGRDTRIQAIYALKGKPLNTYDATVDRMLSNKEFADLIHILGTGVGESFNLDGLKYHKIIIMSDADTDGHHISSLLLTFFFQHARPLIENGHVYVARSPLYRVQEKGKYVYLLDDEEYEAYVRRRITSKFKVAVLNDEGEIVDVMDDDEFDALLSKCVNRYPELLDRISNSYGIDPEVLEFIVDYLVWNTTNDAKEVLNEDNLVDLSDTLKNHFPDLEGILYEDENGQLELGVEGFAGDQYQNFFINKQILEEIEPLLKMIDDNNLDKIAYSENGEDWYQTYPGTMLKMMWNTCLPKSRTRLKGLGESNPEELWETTMDPKNRSLIQVEIEDFEKTGDIIEVLMGKDADKRKVFLDSRRGMISVEELDV